MPQGVDGLLITFAADLGPSPQIASFGRAGIFLLPAIDLSAGLVPLTLGERSPNLSDELSFALAMS